jgi:hypothetical protein
MSPREVSFPQAEPQALERLANLGYDLRQQTHAERNTHGDNEHGPQVVDDRPGLTKQAGEIQ